MVRLYARQSIPDAKKGVVRYGGKELTVVQQNILETILLELDIMLDYLLGWSVNPEP